MLDSSIYSIFLLVLVNNEEDRKYGSIIERYNVLTQRELLPVRGTSESRKVRLFGTFAPRGRGYMCIFQTLAITAPTPATTLLALCILYKDSSKFLAYLHHSGLAIPQLPSARVLISYSVRVLIGVAVGQNIRCQCL